MSDTEFYLGVALIIAICIAVFLLLRFFFCWYWKINKRISIMEEQNRLLQEIIDQLRSRQSGI